MSHSRRHGKNTNVMVEFVGTVEAFEKRVLNQVKKVIAETAEMLVSQAKALVPVDTSNLKGSIDVEYSSDGLSAHIIVGAFYGIYVEFGTGVHAIHNDGRKTPWVYYNERYGRWIYTRGNKPQPYFYPALEVAARHFEREMNKIG